MWILSLLIFILILGIIILVHEFGHFITAKKSGVHIYEFSIGMGPIIYTKKGKDKIDYNIRAFPIGGFVSMAGEVYEDDKKIKKKAFLCNRPWYQRLIILVAGVFNNFLLAFVLLFVLALFWGASDSTPKIEGVVFNSAAYRAGIKEGDTLLAINGHRFNSWDVGQIYLYYENKSNVYTFEVEHENGTQSLIELSPTIEKTEKGEERKVFGIQMGVKEERGIIASIKYAFTKFFNIMKTMALTIGGLITGKISVRNLSGPVGIYQVVDQSVKLGLQQLIYLTAYLSINVGFINILPFPAFDGGHVFFMILEKIMGKKINSKIENTVTIIGFGLLMLLMAVVTIHDIIRLF